MKIQPVKIKRKPGYPTIKTFVDNPELLSKSVPFAWIRNQYAATTLATFILCGCGNQSNGQKAKPATVIVNNDIKKDKLAAIKSVKNDPVKVARIFSHGDGSGAIGCEVMSPPVFISEDEARMIIFTALKAENLVFSTTNCPVLKFMATPLANDCLNAEQKKKSKKAKVEIKIDGYNAKNNLAIEYVSVADFKKFRTDDGCYSSAEGIGTQKAAYLIRDELVAQGKMNAVVFYDPMPYVKFNENELYKITEEKANKLAREQLLEQVKDFIDWIKKEVIIKN